MYVLLSANVSGNVGQIVTHLLVELSAYYLLCPSQLDTHRRNKVSVY